jgi:hypothetical protein
MARWAVRAVDESVALETSDQLAADVLTVVVLLQENDWHYLSLVFTPLASF